MNNGTLALMIPVLGLCIGVLGVFFGGVHKLWKLRIDAARARSGAGELAEVLASIDALRAEVEQVRVELAETQERLDFAERLLAQAGQSRRLPGAE